MTNPIKGIFEKQKPFTYLHTHVVDRAVLDVAITAKKSLELDISIDPDGLIYVGHPLPMYTFYNLPPPTNVPLDIVLQEAKAANIFLMFDVKDVSVLPRVQSAIEEYGADNCILHSCVKELVFTPYSKKIIVEPHWNDEQLSVVSVLAVKDATAVPVAVCCRGLSQELIDSQGEQSVIDTILSVAKDKAEVVVLNLPKDELPPLSIMEALLAHNILTLFNVDHIPDEHRPKLFLGSTDMLEHASDPNDFR